MYNWEDEKLHSASWALEVVAATAASASGAAAVAAAGEAGEPQQRNIQKSNKKDSVYCPFNRDGGKFGGRFLFIFISWPNR